MSVDARNEIWDATYYTLYECGYNELYSDKMLMKWKRFDDFSKVIIALATSVAAGATGFAIMHAPNISTSILILSAVSAGLAIISTALHAPDMLKSWSDSKSEFGALYTELETFMFRMKINPDFSIADYDTQFQLLRIRYGQSKDRIPIDSFTNKSIGKMSQKDQNERIFSSPIQPNPIAKANLPP